MTDSPLADAAALNAFLHAHAMCALYFTGPDCAVCKALKPKLTAMLAERFPEIAFDEVDCARTPALSAALGVFMLPTLIVFIEGRESLRRSRAFGLGALEAELERPYSILFG